jgi:hypothetical protein
MRRFFSREFAFFIGELRDATPHRRFKRLTTARLTGYQADGIIENWSLESIE